MSWTFCVQTADYRIHLRLVDDYRFHGGHYCTNEKCRRIRIPESIVKQIQSHKFEKYAGMTNEEFLVRTFGKPNSR